MRRCIASSLLLVFLLQTSGAAIAGPLTLAQNGVRGVVLMASLTESASRYAAEHAPAPTFPTNTSATLPPAKPRLPRAVGVSLGMGVRVPLSGMIDLRQRPFDFKNPPKDPLAMSQSAASQSGTTASAKGLKVTPTLAPAPSPSTDSGTSLGASPDMQTALTSMNDSLDTSTPTTTGFRPWWVYEGGKIPGAGQWYVNESNGNLLLVGDDINVAERGINLAYRRVYNHQMGSLPSWGGGWSGTFDTRMYYDSANNRMSVLTADGSRDDYCSNGVGGWVSCTPGVWEKLYYDGGCGYLWVKKNGTTYDFTSPTPMCGYAAGYLGRIYRIYGRNKNNYVQPQPYWLNGDASSDANLTQIIVFHSDGQSMTIAYETVNGHHVVQSVTRPDGKVVGYFYDGNGNLSDVCKIGNGAVDSNPGPCSSTQIHIQYDGGTQVFGANWVDTNNAQGAHLYFGNNNPTTTVEYTGVVNPIPGDGLNLALQGSYGTGAMLYRTDTFSYSTGQTVFYDSEGHETVFDNDVNGRLTTKEDWTGSLWLITTEAWDTNNNLTAETDARGNETDYAYDANGNTIAVAQPQVSTSMGTLRPTATYSYDAYNNVTAYCDPNFNASGSGWEWISGPPSQTDTLCPSTTGAARFTYDTSDSQEPYGKLTDTYTPLGYHVHLTYDTGGQSGDAGLPTQVQGDAYQQNDSTNRQPTQTFTYNSYGDLTAYNKGNGAWALTYDNLNRLTSAVDPDSVGTWTCYQSDGSTFYTESASQHALDGSPGSCSSTAPGYADAFAYDADGNEVSEAHHYNETTTNGVQAGVTQKWYDGDDRLIEVEQPQDTVDAYQFPWLTRYIYDLTQNGLVTVGSASGLRAHGNLYKTEECLVATQATIAAQAGALPQIAGPCSFGISDIRGNSFDSTDRPLTKYEGAFGATAQTTNTYDTSGNEGLLSQTVNAAGQSETFSYDSDGHATAQTFGDGVTPNRTFAYDPDGHTTTLGSATLGNAVRTYDADGRLLTAADPTNLTNPGTITYAYYPDGLRKALSLSIPSIGYSQSGLFAYNYRPDGLRSSLASTAGPGGTFAWTYSNAGRMLTQSDPDTGDVVNLSSPAGSHRTLQAMAYTYDAYGQVSGFTLPRNTAYTTFSYDVEGNPLKWTAGDGVGNITQAYTRRNEAATAPGNSYANGANCQADARTCVVDTRSDQLESTDYYVNGTDGHTYDTTHTFAYDAAGREVTDGVAQCHIVGDPAVPPIVSQRNYDSDSHITQQTVPEDYITTEPTCGSGVNGPASPPNPGDGTTNVYAWGPDGQLAQMATTIVQTTGGTQTSSTETSTLHWDGNDLLYTYNSSNGNAWLQINVEKFGAISRNHGTWATSYEVFDRDWTGYAINEHTGSGYTGLKIDPSHALKCHAGKCLNQNLPLFGGPSSPNFTPNSGPFPNISPQRADGYADLYNNMFQGVRAYDPSMGQWTSPDAYAGDVDDPMSQKPFIWNGNNPMAYSDPSGYAGEDERDSDPNEEEFWLDTIAGEIEDEQLDRVQDFWSKGNYSSGRDNAASHLVKRGNGDMMSDEFAGWNVVDLTNEGLRLYQEGVNNVGGVTVFDEKGITYAVYDKQSGTIGVFEADGKIVTVLDVGALKPGTVLQALKDRGGKEVSSIPCKTKQ